MRGFEVEYEVTVVYDSGRELQLTAYSQAEYLVRARPYLADTRVKVIWVRRVERFMHRKLIPTTEGSTT